MRPRPEPQTALLQLAVLNRPTPPAPSAITPPGATSVQPVVARQPGPGMRTVSVAASEWVQPGVSTARLWRRGALTLALLGGVLLGTLALIRISEPDAPVSVKISTREPHAASSSLRSARSVQSAADETSSAAEEYYDLKLYKQARTAAEQTVKQEPVKSWELIGRASCALKEPIAASEALSHLEASPAAEASRQALTAACDSFGFALRSGRFRHK